MLKCTCSSQAPMNMFLYSFFVENPAGSSFLLSRVYLVRFVLLILVYITYKLFWGLQTELCGLSSLHNNVQLAQPLYDSSLNSLIKRMLLQLCASICLKFLHECLEVLFPRGATQMAITHGIIIKKKVHVTETGVLWLSCTEATQCK